MPNQASTQSQNQRNYWKDKVVWLTGASSGIGKEIALRLIKAGAKVALTARRFAEIEEFTKELPKSQFAIFAGDVSDRHQMIAIGRGVFEQWGRIDVLIANAGILADTLVEQFESRHVEQAMSVNFFGVVYAIEAVLPYMKSECAGQIVAVSSVASFRGLPNLAAYGASKAALSHFLESLRIDLADYKIHVSVVHPGFVQTKMIEDSTLNPMFMVSSASAADMILYGVSKREFEIHFPWKFTLFMKFLSLFPYKLYFQVVRKFRNLA